MNNRIILKSIVLIFLWVTSSSGQNKIDSKKSSFENRVDKIAQIDSLMKMSYARGVFNGNVLVIKQNDVIYENEFGYTDASKTIKLDSESIFNIGSIAKEFNAVAIMMLEEKGLLSLDDKLSKFNLQLPLWADGISVKNLLNYTSGLPRVNWGSVKNDNDIFNDLRQLQHLEFNPNSNYLYSNNNVFLQRRIVEKVTGISFNDFVQKYILKPCKMENSLIDPTESNQKLVRAFNNNSVNNKWFDIDFSGWVYPTAKDMYKWLNCLHSGKLITQQSIEKLSKSYSKNSQSALGNVIYKDDEFLIHKHHGSSFDYESLIYFNAKEHLSIILMTNNKNHKLQDISKAIVNILNNRPFLIPKKSVYYSIKDKCFEDIDSGIKLYYSLKENNSEAYNFLDENELNQLGYKLIEKNKIEEAIKIFKLLISEFPNSSNPYDSIGEAYYLNGNLDLALVNYKKSLDLNPDNTNAKEMIKEIDRNK